MLDLREQLQRCFQGRVCLLGLGNADHGDDGFGVRLAEALAAAAHPSVVVLVAGTSPERVVGRVANAGYDHVVFLDAADFGALPGSVVLLDAEQIASRFPQVSTHQLSLGLLARQVEANGRTRAWLLGVQPESLRPGAALSPAVRTTFELLRELLQEVATEVLV